MVINNHHHTEEFDDSIQKHTSRPPPPPSARILRPLPNQLSVSKPHIKRGTVPRTNCMFFVTQRSVVKVLLETGAAVDARAKYGRTPLHRAARVYGNNESVVKVLIDSGAVVDAKDTKKRHLEVVQALIEAGADVNAKTAFGDNTPLKICAYYEGNLEVARALIEKGAGRESQDGGGFTPLYWRSERTPRGRACLDKAGSIFYGFSNDQVADLLRKVI